MKAMGIDFGLARIGIALSDDTKFLASPFETYNQPRLRIPLVFVNFLAKTRLTVLLLHPVFFPLIKPYAVC